MAQDLLGFFQGGAFFGGDQVFLGHHIVNEPIHIGLELQVTVGDDADELALVADGHAGDVIFSHEGVGLAQGVAGSQPEGVGDDAVFRALDHVHLLCLGGDGHILMNDADAAFSGNGDGHAILGNGVHCGGHHRNIQLDFFGQLSVQINIHRMDLAFCRNQQNVIKSEPLF